MPPRLLVTAPAAELVRRLRQQHGKLIFHLSGGCCEGSAPMCLRDATFRTGAGDIRLGEVESCPFYVAASHYPVWANTELTLDVLPDGGGDSFSLEAADGARFIVRSRLLAADEPVT